MQGKKCEFEIPRQIITFNDLKSPKGRLLNDEFGYLHLLFESGQRLAKVLGENRHVIVNPEHFTPYQRQLYDVIIFLRTMHTISLIDCNTFTEFYLWGFFEVCIDSPPPQKKKKIKKKFCSNYLFPPKYPSVVHFFTFF